MGGLGEIRSAEFVEKEFNIPSMPSPHQPKGYPLSSMSDDQLMDIVAPRVPGRVHLASYDAAASLLSLKTGLTPPKDDAAGAKDSSIPLVSLQDKTNFPAAMTNKKWTYPRPSEQEQVFVHQSAFLQKENLVPKGVASQRRFSYPSPHATKLIKQEVLSPAGEAVKPLDAQPAISSPVVMKKIKGEMMSPSHEITTKTNSLDTSMTKTQPRGAVWFEFSNKALLNTIHPGDNTPVKTIHAAFKQCQGLTLKTAKQIEFSPIETKGHLERSSALDLEMFSPVKHFETHTNDNRYTEV